MWLDQKKSLVWSGLTIYHPELYKCFNYYDINYKITNNDEKNEKIVDISNEIDDNKFSKVIAGIQVVKKYIVKNYFIF